MSDNDGYTGTSGKFGISATPKSMGNDLYLDSAATDSVIDAINSLKNNVSEVLDSIKKIEADIKAKEWYTTAESFDSATLNSHSFGTADNSNTPCGKLYRLIDASTDSINSYFGEPSFAGLINSLGIIKQAILDYSNGVNTRSALSNLQQWISLSTEGESSFNGKKSSGYASLSTIPVLNSDLPEALDKEKEEEKSEAPKLDTSDSDDILSTGDNVSSDLTDKSNDGSIGSIIGSVVRSAPAAGVGAGILGTISDFSNIIQPDEPVEVLEDENEDKEEEEDSNNNVFDDIKDTFSSIVVPNAGKFSESGTKVKSSSIGVVAPAALGVGTIASGIVGGKMYSDNRNSEEEEESFNNQSDEFFDEKSEEEALAQGNNMSMVDFKNNMLDDMDV